MFFPSLTYFNIWFHKNLSSKIFNRTIDPSQEKYSEISLFPHALENIFHSFAVGFPNHNFCFRHIEFPVQESRSLVEKSIFCLYLKTLCKVFLIFRRQIYNREIFQPLFCGSWLWHFPLANTGLNRNENLSYVIFHFRYTPALDEAKLIWSATG